MKLRILFLATAVAAQAASARGQDHVPQPLVRADAWAGFGWHHARLAEEGEYDEWYHRSLSGTLGAAWYWTDHLRTEVDAGVTSRGRVYIFEPLFGGGQPTGRYGWIRHRTGAVGVTQQYQFFRNAWFHPYVGAGLDVVHETSDEHLEPLFQFDRVTGRGQVLEPATEESSSRMRIRPAGSLGFKGYLSRRAYFRTDARIGFRKQIEDVVVRFGFGVDF